MRVKSLFSSFMLTVGAAALTLVVFSAEPARAADSAKEFEKQMDAYLQSDQNMEKIGNALESYFRRKREQQEKDRESAETKAMEDQFKNPVKIDIGDSPVRGKKDAKVTIVEFSDFQCPFCQRGAGTMEQVLKAYPNDVKVVFKNLPLPFHDHAKGAAKAALAANEQGKFWEMHDLLFANQQQLSDETYVEYAKKLGLNVDKFKADSASEKIDKALQADIELAGKNGVQGTPGFFVNGVQISGARPFDTFKQPHR